MAFNNQGSRRVLVVDDNRDAADTLALILSLEGFEVRQAYDGIQALVVSREFHPDFAVLDLNMAKLDGYDTASAMALFRLPPTLVAVSADNSETSRERTAKLGFVAHLVKPLEPQLLLKTLRSSLPPPDAP